MRVSFDSSSSSYTSHTRFASVNREAIKQEISPHQLKFGSSSLSRKKSSVSFVIWLILASLMAGEILPFAEFRGRKNAKARTEQTARGERTEEKGEPEHPHTHDDHRPGFPPPTERSCSRRKFVAGIGCPYGRLAPHRFWKVPCGLSRTILIT